MSSQWFCDAFDTRSGAEETFQRGKLMLPALPKDTEATSLLATLKLVKKKIGNVGKEALKKYIEDAGIDENTEAMQMLNEVFQAMKSPKAGAKARAGKTKR